MANPAADYPAQLHDPTDISAKASSALGSTPKKHSEVHGKIEQEILEIQKKLGTGESDATSATIAQILTRMADGTTAWQDAPEGVPDEAWETLNLSGKIQGSLGLSQAVQYITSSACVAFWNRIGRKLEMTGLIFIPADADWGTPDPFFPINPIVIDTAELPFTPRIYPELIPNSGLAQPNVGDFSILNTSDSMGQPIPDNSMAIGSVITNFGGSLPSPIFTFFHASRATAGNLENLVFDGNQVDLIGNVIVIYFNVHYECAYEEGYMNIAGTFTSPSLEDEAYSSDLPITISSPFQLDLTAEVSSGALPAGLSLGLTGTTLTLSGTPTTPGTSIFEVTITGDNGDIFTKEFTVTISAYVPPDGIQIDDDFTAAGTDGEAYSSVVNVILESEGEQLPITFDVVAGALPTGLSLALANDTELTLSGTPTIPGSYTFTIEITDTNGATYEKEFTVDIQAFLLLLNNGSYPNWSEDIAYDEFLVATYEDNSQLPLSVSVVSGALPAGISVSIQNDDEVRISGTTTVPGTYNFTLELEDALGTTTTEDYSITISTYNPELEPLYLGTVSGNSLNIVFDNGDPGQSIVSYVASAGEICKIRSGTMTYDFGEGPLNVPVGGFIIFEGGFWREYIY